MSRVAGQVAFVTGAGQAIGEATALRLADDGFAAGCAGINDGSGPDGR